MNLTEAKIKIKAVAYAKKLLKQTEKNEPQISADLRKIASEASAGLVGLENKFKTEKSLTEKIAQKAGGNARIFTESGFSLSEAIAKASKLQAEKINDALRYTFVLPFESYIFSFKQILEKLKQSGYTLPENKIWNAWKNAGTNHDTGYRGINLTVISSQGQIFELQFHTEESFHLKMKTHKLYKEAVSTKTSDERKRKAIQVMVESAKNISTPKGATKI